MAKINRENISDHLLDYELGMIGKSTQEAIMTKEYYNKWTITQEQYDEFRVYAIPLLKKVFKCRKERAESVFAWFNSQFGLKISNK